MYITIFQLLCTSLMGEMPCAMTSFLTNEQMTVHPTISGHCGALSVWNVAYPGSAAGLPCYVTQCSIGTYVETRKAAHFLSLRQVLAVFRGWIGRVVRDCPLHTALQKEIMTSNFDICIGHGPPFW